MTELLYGRNAVYESLRAQRRRHTRVIVATGAQESGAFGESIALAERMSLPVERIERRRLDELLRDANHQGIALETSPYPYVDLSECLEAIEGQRKSAFFLLFDHLQDPQNVGTLLRTAEIVGIDGVVLPNKRSATITPAVVNASSGAAEHVRIAQVSNLAQAIADLQKNGIWVAGLEDDERAQVFDEVDLNMPLAIVVGAEGVGLARLTRERCDLLIKLPMQGMVASLNVAVAGSIALYQAWRQRTRGLSVATKE